MSRQKTALNAVRPFALASLILSSAASAFSAESSPAQPQPQQAAGTASSAPGASGGWTLNGYFDVYASYNFNRPRETAPTTINALAASQNGFHSYVFYNRQVSLNLAEIAFRHVRPETTFLAELQFGPFADANHTTSLGTTVDDVSKHVGQAIFYYAPKGSRFSLDVGKMYTHLGLELPRPRENWNYSRGFLYGYGLPVWHVGARAGYAIVPEQLVLSAFIYNGWNNLYDVNSAPTWGLQLKGSPSSGTTWAINGIAGPEQAGDSPFWRAVVEANISHALTDSLSVAASALYGVEGGGTGSSVGTTNVSWGGAELLGRMQFSKLYSLAARAEYYSDINGYTLGGYTTAGQGQLMTSYTLTNGFALAEGWELRAEGRLDVSSLASRFTTRDGTSGTQGAVMLGMLYTM